MALSNESNTSLAFDTTELRSCADKYSKAATELRTLAKNLDNLLVELKSSGWTTPAGSAFHKMVNTNWQTNIERYTNLLDTLENIILQSCADYESLVSDYVEQVDL